MSENASSLFGMILFLFALIIAVLVKQDRDELKAEANQSKTILIVGHSNTSPRLVNLLLDKDEYKDLDETVYNQYWIVKLYGRKKHAKVILY